MPHYYDQHQDTPYSVKKITLAVHQQSFSFFTSSGVFSKDKVDKGTLVLATYMDIPKKADVLDMGCGIGILGIVASKLYQSITTFVDTNTRALTLTKQNIKENKVTAPTVFHSDLYTKLKNKTYDVILSNPPQSAGKKVCFDLIEGAFHHLKKGGSLQLVARKNKGGQTLQKKMEEMFGSSEVLAKKSGYWVYKSTKQ